MLLEEYWDYLWFHNLKPKKVVNALQYLLWGKRSARLRHYPLFYMLETGNVCRLRCPFCVQGNYDSQVNSSKRLMGYDDFLVILRKIQDYALVIDLFKHGEPFLNPEIVRMTAAASAAGLRCRISSALNFTLTDEMARAICRSGLYKLTCAIDGVSQRAYQKYRVNGDLRLALDNAARIIRARNAARRRRPIIIFRMLVFEWNHEQVEAARQLAVEMGFDRFAADPGVSIAGDQAVIWDMAGRRWQKTQWHLESVFPGRTVDPAGLPKSPTTCPSLFNSLVLGADCSNMVCCHSNRKAWEHASLLDRSLEEVWNSEPYIKTREYAFGRTTDRAQVFPQCEHCCWL